MPIISANTLIIILGFICLLTELVLGVDTGFDLVLVGINFLIGGIVGEIVSSWQIALTITGILSVLYVIFGRSFLKDKLHVTTHKTNTDALEKAEGLVVTDITPAAPGRIRVHSEEWRAISDQAIKKGEKVVVEQVRGVTLTVKKI